MKIIQNQAGITREYSRIFLKVILVLENLSKVRFWIQTRCFHFPSPYFGPQCPQIAVPQPKIGPQCPYLAVPPHIKWTSMSISGDNAGQVQTLLCEDPGWCEDRTHARVSKHQQDPTRARVSNKRSSSER